MKKLIILLALFIPLIAYAIPKPEVVVEEDDVVPSHWVIEDRITDLSKPAIRKFRITQYIYKTFPEQPELALAIAKAESGLNTYAHGDKNNRLAVKGSHGIFQINVAVHEDLIGDRDVNYYKDNIDIAREIYDMAGSWQPWGVFTNGSYKRHLK